MEEIRCAKCDPGEFANRSNDDEDAVLRRRAQQATPLTRPSLAVLLAYAKLDLDAELLASDEWVGSVLPVGDGLDLAARKP